MKLRRLPILFCCVVLACAGAVAHAQGAGGRAPGGPPGGRGPGGPPPGGGPGGPGSNASGPGGGGPGSASSGPRGNVTTASGLKLGPPGRWWDDRAVSSQIGLRKDQQRRMDAIFDKNKPAIVSTYLAYQKQQGILQKLSTAATVDKQQVFAAIDSVSQARAALQKANTEMLLQIRSELDADQVSRLERLP